MIDLILTYIEREVAILRTKNRKKSRCKRNLRDETVRGEVVTEVLSVIKKARNDVSKLTIPPSNDLPDWTDAYEAMIKSSEILIKRSNYESIKSNV